MFFHELQRSPAIILLITTPCNQHDKLATLLNDAGYSLLIASEINMAFQLYRNTKPDVILWDSSECAAREPGNDLNRFIADQALLDPSMVAIDISKLTQPIHTHLKHTIAAELAHRQLEELQSFSEAIARTASDALIIANTSGRVVFANAMVSTLYKQSAQDTLHVHASDDGNHSQSIQDGQMLLQCFANAQNRDSIELVDGLFEYNCELEDDKRVDLSFLVKAFTLNRCTYYTVVVKDNRDKKAIEAQIRSYAFYDPITNLPNRILLKERLATEIIRTKRTQTQLGVFYIDLDRFKYINDTLGLAIGDALLAAVGDRIVNTLRADDFVARLGGDEFLVLAPGLTKGEYIGKIADNLLIAMKEPFKIGDETIYISGSIGIALAPEDGITEAELLANAEIAMYRAKEKEKGSFESFTRELSDRAMQRMALEHDLRKGIENNEFVVYYQPKVDTDTESVVGMEALVRWMHPTRGLVPPNDFIPLAEETGLIVTIGKWVLEQACKDNKALQTDGYAPMIVSVNLSMRQFEKREIINTVIQTLNSSALAPEWLELEITESIAMLNIDNTLSIIRELQDHGVKFSIDDFGTGYSSLSKLGALAVDKLKIDKSFISNMNDTDNDTVIASTILSLGKNLNMQIVAEGVETKEQVAFLKDNQCDELQGYYFGKPMTITAFREWIATFNPQAMPKRS